MTLKTYQFSLPDQDGLIFNSDEHLPLIVYFYPKDNTPGCTIEAIDFTNSLDEIKSLGYQLVGISRDNIASHQNFRDKHKLSIRLLSDPNETVCKLFDVIKEKNMYSKKVLGIERSTFILNKAGQIIKEYRKVKAANHVTQVVDFLKSLTN